jgi:lipoprotein NlpI
MAHTKITELITHTSRRNTTEKKKFIVAVPLHRNIENEVQIMAVEQSVGNATEEGVQRMGVG